VGHNNVWKVWKRESLDPKAGQEKFTTNEINEPRNILLFMKH